MYVPKSEHLAIVRSRISPKSWSARVAKAQQDEAVMQAILQRVAAGATLNDAIAQEVPPSRRSWVMRRWLPYAKEGFEALVDARTPRAPRLTPESAAAIRSARAAKPSVTLAEVEEILRMQQLKLPSKASNSVCSVDHWCWEQPLPTGNPLNAVWGSGASDVWAVGDSGTLLHWNGTAWSGVVSGTTRFMGVWGSGPSDVWAVGYDRSRNTGATQHWNGTSWSAVASGTKEYLNAVWGSGPSDVYAVSGGGSSNGYSHVIQH